VSPAAGGQTRPAPDRLTEFYLLMSLGGVVGGAFTALLAPVIFRTVLEYPLVLVLVGLARPNSKAPIRKWEIYAFVAAVLICLAPPVLKGVFDADWNLAWAWSRNVNASIEQTTQIILLFAMIAAFLIRDRMPAYVVICALIAIVTLIDRPGLRLGPDGAQLLRRHAGRRPDRRSVGRQASMC
jgi:hypothetical protein